MCACDLTYTCPRCKTANVRDWREDDCEREEHKRYERLAEASGEAVSEV